MLQPPLPMLPTLPCRRARERLHGRRLNNSLSLSNLTTRITIDAKVLTTSNDDDEIIQRYAATATTTMTTTTLKMVTSSWPYGINCFQLIQVSANFLQFAIFTLSLYQPPLTGLIQSQFESAILRFEQTHFSARYKLAYSTLVYTSQFSNSIRSKAIPSDQIRLD